MDRFAQAPGVVVVARRIDQRPVDRRIGRGLHNRFARRQPSADHDAYEVDRSADVTPNDAAAVVTHARDEDHAGIDRQIDRPAAFEAPDAPPVAAVGAVP